jgi:hypothetical protein
LRHACRYRHRRIRNQQLDLFAIRSRFSRAGCGPVAATAAAAATLDLLIFSGQRNNQPGDSGIAEIRLYPSDLIKHVSAPNLLKIRPYSA